MNKLIYVIEEAYEKIGDDANAVTAIAIGIDYDGELSTDEEISRRIGLIQFTIAMDKGVTSLIKALFYGSTFKILKNPNEVFDVLVEMDNLDKIREYLNGTESIYL